MKRLLVRLLVPLFLVAGFVGQAFAKDLVNDIDAFTKLFVNKQGASFEAMFEFELSSLATLRGDFSSILSSVRFDEFKIVGNDSVVVGSTPNSKFFFDLPSGGYMLNVEGTVLSSPAAGFTGLMSAVPVPEPAEWMMILAGVAMMGFVVSRRRNT